MNEEETERIAQATEEVTTALVNQTKIWCYNY